MLYSQEQITINSLLNIEVRGTTASDSTRKWHANCYAITT